MSSIGDVDFKRGDAVIVHYGLETLRGRSGIIERVIVTRTEEARRAGLPGLRSFEVRVAGGLHKFPDYALKRSQLLDVIADIGGEDLK